MRSPARRLLACLLLPTLASLGGSAAAFGPGVHVREADHYAEVHPEWADDDLRPYLRFGAVFPDIRSAGVDLPVNSHDKALGEAIEAVAQEEGVPWKVAFARGYRLHTASDTSAQVFYIPWLNAETDLQVVDLFCNPGIGAVGDNELLVEGFGDVHSGHMTAFVDAAWLLLMEEPERLEALVDLFVAGLRAHVGETFDEEAVRAEILALWDDVADKVGGFDPQLVKDLLVEAKTWDLATVVDVLTSGIFQGLLGDVPNAPDSTEPDPYEIRRLEEHPLGQDPAAYFSAYDEHFEDLGRSIFDDPAFAPWPWWHGQAMISGVVQGLARHAEPWAHRSEVLLWDAGFEGPDGAGIDALSAGDAPGTVVAWSELFVALGGPVEVTMEIVPDVPGVLASATDGEVIASDTAVVVPGAERTFLEAAFEPGPHMAAAEGFTVRWRVEGDDRPYLSSDWDRYVVYADAPLFRPPYDDGYAGFPPHLPVAHAEPVVDWGWLVGSVVLPDGRRGLAADVALDAVPVTVGPGGGFGEDGVEPGAHVLEAWAEGWVGLPTEVEVVAGERTRVELPMTPVPLVEVPAWAPQVGFLHVAWSSEHFVEPPPGFEVALGDADDPEAMTPWTAAGEGPEVDVDFAEEPMADGTAVYVRVRAEGGPPSEPGVVRVDGTPPAAPDLEVLAADCGVEVRVRVTGDDPHAPVVAREASVDGETWLPGDPVVLPWPGGEGPVTVRGCLTNAAGLVSETTEVVVCEPAPPEPEPEPDASPTEDAVSGPDVHDAGPLSPDDDSAEVPSGEPDAEPAGGGDGGGGCAGGPGGAPRLPVVALLVLLARLRWLHVGVGPRRT
ncbi:MAG: hypothetical protein ACQEXJ_20240 [Myxococcota bacterium]